MELGKPVLLMALLSLTAAPCFGTEVVRLPPGDTVLVETRRLGPEASGRIYRGADDGSTRLTGAVPLVGWKDRGDGVWSVKAPSAADGTPLYTETLFVNGRRATRARFPDAGYFSPVETPVQVEAGDSPTGFRQRVRLPPDAAALFADLPSGDLPFAQLVVHVKWDVARYPLESFADGVVTVAGREMKSWNVWSADDLYSFENVRSAFDAPGEWFYDAAAGQILYRPLAGEAIREAFVPRDGLETLVAVDGASDIVFENVTFACSAPTGTRGPTRLAPYQAACSVSSAAVTVDRSTNVVFRNCRFEKTGNYAVWFRRGVSGGGAFGCEMTDLGAGGVRIGTHEYGVKPAVVTAGVTVDDCLVADGGRFHPAGVGVLVGHASDCSVVHNEIRDLYYTGVSVGWVWGYAGSVAQRNTVAFNRIHDLGKRELADMGGVYTLGTSFGTCVSNNVIHDIHSYSYGGWGLYPDEGSEGIVFENNLVYATDDASFHQHYGRDNVLRNNILLDSGQGQVAVTLAEDHRSLVCTNNVIVWSDGDAFVKYDGTRSERAKIDWRANLWWRRDGKESFNGGAFADWCGRVKDVGSVFADPRLGNGFVPAPDSPARTLGFRPFDPSLAGRRPRR